MAKRSKQSAGLLVYRFKNVRLEVFLIHPGGPLWKNKDLGAWSIPKGEFPDEEDPLDAAKREVKEETDHEVDGEFIPLTPVKQKSGKVVYAWGVKDDIDPEVLSSNTFKMEWPPKSGKYQEFPEADKGGWFDYYTALDKVHSYLKPMLEELVEKLDVQESEL